MEGTALVSGRDPLLAAREVVVKQECIRDARVSRLNLNFVRSLVDPVV